MPKSEAAPQSLKEILSGPVALEKIEVKSNIRKHFDSAKLRELTDNVRQVGILEPVLLRPNGKQGAYYLVAGERRLRAAKEVGLKEIPARVLELDESQATEIQALENLHREDLHPMEEAKAYSQLLTVKGYDPARIAGRIGRSVQYVYDRLKLLNLTAPLVKLFEQGKITAGHAILLSRLEPKAQAMAASPDGGGLWESEGGLFDPRPEARGEEDEPGSGFKPRSVRELQAWIDEHVKFKVGSADSFLFPETVAAAKAAAEQAEKIVGITYDDYVQREARDDQRIIGPRSWARADGKFKSKTCEHSVTGVVVVGPGRGEAFKVCTNKEKCKTHWRQFHRERAERAKRMASGGAKSAETRFQKEEERRKAEREKQEAENNRWIKARPAILQALADAVKKAPATVGSYLGSVVLNACSRWGTVQYEKFLEPGKTAEDFLRYAAFVVLADETDQYNASERFPKKAKALGIDLKAIIEREAPGQPKQADKKSDG